MNKTEFNNFSLLQLENEVLREKLESANKRLELMQMTIDALTDIITNKDGKKSISGETQ
jgi:uncharacterized protein YjiS (DUF1127 family)